MWKTCFFVALFYAAFLCTDVVLALPRELRSLDETVGEVAAPAPNLGPMDPGTGQALEPPPVLPDAPVVDTSDGITLGDGSAEIPVDVDFSDTGTSGQASAVGPAAATSGSDKLLASMVTILLPAALLGAIL